MKKLYSILCEIMIKKVTVTRQTVSRWESDEVTPDLSKLVNLEEYMK